MAHKRGEKNASHLLYSKLSTIDNIDYCEKCFISLHLYDYGTFSNETNFSKLGLDRDPLLDTAEDEGKEVQKQEKSEEKTKCVEKQAITLHEPVNPKAPCEDDFETIRVRILEIQ